MIDRCSEKASNKKNKWNEDDLDKPCRRMGRALTNQVLKGSKYTHFLKPLKDRFLWNPKIKSMSSGLGR